MEDLQRWEFDAEGLLAFAESTLLQRRQLDVDDLRACAHWCMLHGEPPARESRGGPRLVRVGGAGTPPVQDLSLAELALARRTHVLATRSTMADVLDLIHRLPRCWQVVEALECEVWVARRVARMTRHLTHPEAAYVDTAVADALAGEQPGRLFTLVEAKIIEANPTAHAHRIAAERARRYVSVGRVDEAGLRHVIARVEHGDAIWVDALIGRIADILAERDTATGAPERDVDLRRSEAFGWLARPAELLALLLEHADDAADPAENAESAPVDADTGADPGEDAEPDDEPGGEPGAGWIRGFPARLLEVLRSINPAKLRPQAVVYLHLHQAALTSTGTGVARVEDGGGPRLYEHVKDITGAAHVTITPVIDLNDHININAYEHPHWLRERIHLINPVEPFPHSTRGDTRTGTDIDHVTPYQHTGKQSGKAPPGQTGTHNAAPLSRYAHRVKTHANYTVRQLKPGTYVWRTPHGRHYLVDHTGTHHLDETEAHALILRATAPRMIRIRYPDMVNKPAA
ncbi:hypothetical protein [Nocardioides sp. AE5]|uniref:hypothetical protein n=1 Tax=Nocardioides sp. AE5 TaxID=2962573 RepID=UPI0028826362|nr:hypothetical protein [Nocardioides sp. AE5]MDT0202150.1 hypothetical protein [Nocardioides sp. AE5]